MKDEATPEQLALARKIVSRFVWTPEDGDLSRRTGPQQATARAMETAALAAIIETQRLDAELAEGEFADPGWTSHYRNASSSIATAIRAGQHYGKDQQ